MPATAGRVRMPANNRVHSSAALQTHGIWQSAIGYDPYAPSNQPPSGKDSSSAKDPAAVADGGAKDKDGKDNAYSSFQGLLALARITNTSSADDTRGACRKCGRVGHLTFQCRNFLSAGKDKEPEDIDAAIRAADEAVRKIKKAVAGKVDLDESDEEDDEDDDETDSSDSDVDPEIERILAERAGKKSKSSKEKSNRGRSKSRSKHKKSSKRHARSGDEDDDDDDEVEEIARGESRKRKHRESRKEKKRRRSHHKRDDSDSEKDRARRKHKRRHRRDSSDYDSGTESSEEERKRAKRRHREHRRKRHDESESGSESDRSYRERGRKEQKRSHRE